VALEAAQSICAHGSPHESGGYGCGSDFIQISRGKGTETGGKLAGVHLVHDLFPTVALVTLRHSRVYYKPLSWVVCSVFLHSKALFR